MLYFKPDYRLIKIPLSMNLKTNIILIIILNANL